MTPFTALYRKEFREHRTSFFLMLGCLALCLLLPICFVGEVPPGAFIPYIYLYGFYVTAIAAMSYAKEEENKTSRFLRSLPVASGTILLAKLAWLGTAMLVLSLPALVPMGIEMLAHHGLVLSGQILLRMLSWKESFFWSGLVTLFSLVAWGYFWTTRYPSKLFATLLSYCCVFITYLLCGWFGLQLSMKIGPVAHLQDWTLIFMFGGVFLISLPVAVLGLRRAATFYDRAEPESKPEAFLNSERKDNDRRVRFVTRFFPKDRWTPFQALLWQAICQSRDILFLGLGTAVAFALWQVFFSEQFFTIMNGVHPAIKEESGRWWFVQLLGLGIICTGFLIGFGLGSSIFAQDQERGMYRALGHRGVPARLVWWSRVLPFLVVILVPIPFLVNMVFSVMPEPHPSLTDQQRTLEMFVVFGFVLLLYLAPFCFGTFYSLLFRNVLVSILATFGTWLAYLFGISIGGQIIDQLFSWSEIGYVSLGILVAICVLIPPLFFVASRLMCARWLREEPWSRRWLVPTLVLAVFALYLFGPPTALACYELIHYLTGTRIMTITM